MLFLLDYKETEKGASMKKLTIFTTISLLAFALSAKSAVKEKKKKPSRQQESSIEKRHKDHTKVKKKKKSREEMNDFELEDIED
jgi:hypothetical protein